MKTTLKVKGMTCGHCENAVKGALEELKGVQTVDVDSASGEVAVEHSGETAKESIEESVENQGYDVVNG